MAPDGEALDRLYRLRFSTAEREAKAGLWRVLVENFFQRWIPADGTLLDLGCGQGEFLRFARCARKLGVDAIPSAAGDLPPGVEFRSGDLADLGWISDGSVDTVFTSNVLEHLEDKAQVDRVLREARRVLKPGGLFIAMGPNLRLLTGPYWDFWDHRVPITEKSLVEALGGAGFGIVEAVARFLPFTTKSSLPQAPWLVALYLRLPLFWPLLGRQFLVRARRPTA